MEEKRTNRDLDATTDRTEEEEIAAGVEAEDDFEDDEEEDGEEEDADLGDVEETS